MRVAGLLAQDDRVRRLVDVGAPERLVARGVSADVVNAALQERGRDLLEMFVDEDDLFVGEARVLVQLVEQLHDLLLAGVVQDQYVIAQ